MEGFWGMPSLEVAVCLDTRNTESFDTPYLSDTQVCHHSISHIQWIHHHFITQERVYQIAC